MTLPLQPMSTAPRDGREVLIVLNTGEKQIVEWVGDNPNWVTRNMWTNGCDEWVDGSIQGWLDIEALARDAERLVLLTHALSGDFDDPLALKFFALHKKSTGWTLDRWRAAIDKEMSNG